jgi:cytochrome c
MFDTMTMTKTVGAFCGTLLIFLLGNWAAQSLYFGGGHGEHEAEMAYVIETEDAGSQDTASAEGPDFATIFASADAGKGAKVFGKCKACHKLEKGVNATGPSLYGVVGRPVGSVDGFGYSAAISGLGGEWTPERLNEFLTNPKAYAPGTKMTFSGLKKETDRANLIAYLQSVAE